MVLKTHVLQMVGHKPCQGAQCINNIFRGAVILDMLWHPFQSVATFQLARRKKHNVCQASLSSGSSTFHTWESCSDPVIELDGRLPVFSRIHSKRELCRRSRLRKADLSLEPHDP